MNIGDDLFDTLKGLVANRVRPDHFPQAPATPIWPAIRYQIISGQNFATINDDGTYETDDVRIQIWLVASSSRAREVLWEEVRAAMKTFYPPAWLQGPPTSESNADAKTYAYTVDYIVHGSSASGNSPP